MLKENKTAGLASMYTTLSRSGAGLKTLLEYVASYTYRGGKKINLGDDKAQAVVVIQNLICLKDRLDGFLCNRKQ